MSYQNLEKYRDELVNKVLIGEWDNFRNGHRAYVKNLSETEKRRIQQLISQCVRFENLDTDEPKVWVETSFHSADGHLNNILDQIEKDVFSLLANTDEKAPFTVLRNVLCFCDCVACLRYGKRGGGGDLEQLFDELGPYAYIRRRYCEYKKYLIQLYRHDLVHTIRPWSKMMFVKCNDVLTLGIVGWHITAQLNNKTQAHKADFNKLKNLLAVENNRKNLVHLRVDKKRNQSPVINTYCFLFDLVNYIEELKEQLKTDKETMEQFMKNLIEMIVESSFRLLKHDIPTLDLDNNKTVL